MANLWQQILGQARQIPPLMQQLDFWKLFAYIGNLCGIRNFNQFKVQVMQPGANPNLQGNGNVIPLPMGRATSSGMGNLGGTSPAGLDLTSSQPNLGGGPF